MRAFISVDLEGMPYIVSREHLSPKGTLYNEARKIMTDITLWVAEELYKNGFKEVLIADSHGPMINILVEELPEYVEILRGFPRPTSMVLGVQDCNIAILLGYHAKINTAYSTFDHTYSGSIIEHIEVNGIPASEYLLNAYVSGHYNVPVALVAGEEKLLEDVREFTPWAEVYAMKKSFSRYSSVSKSLRRIKSELSQVVAKAIDKYKNGELKPLKADYPVEMTIRFTNSAIADVAELLPIVRRIDGKTIQYESKDIIEAYKIMELLVMAGYSVIR